MDFDALERLARLKQSGALTIEEFEEQKARLIAVGDNQPRPTRDQSKRAFLLVTAGTGMLLAALAAILFFSDNNTFASDRAAGDRVVASDTGREHPAEPGPITTAAPVSGTASTPPELGRCHMDTCSWSRTLKKQLVESAASGSRLFKLTLLGGTSANDDDPTLKIEWNDDPHVVWVFCSKTLPTAVMQLDDRSWQVEVFDFRMVPGVLQSGANLYANTCYGSGREGDWDALAQLHTPLTDDPYSGELPDISISQPMDLLAREKELLEGR